MQRDAVRSLYEGSAPVYQKAPGLVRKYYLYGEGPSGGGVYVWRDRDFAERFYTAEWRKNLKDRLGSEPEVTLFDSPVILDNRTNEIILT
jgi:hypothetical protein